MITTSPNKLYKVELTGASPSVQHILDLSSAASGIAYNGVTGEIVWGEGRDIKIMPAAGSTPSAYGGKYITLSSKVKK